jgi:hypothetical protein
MRTLAILSLLSATASAETALTIYNQSLAVVRETIPLDLKAGDSLQSFDRATACAEPDSVVLRDPTGKNAFSILEQSYRNDPVSQAMLLSHFEGREIDFRIAYPDGKTEVKPGKIVRSGYVPGGGDQEPLIEMDGKLCFQLPGQPLFPALGDDSILRPTLGWTIHSDAAAKFNAQLSYLSDGLQWQATYNLVAPEKSDTVSLTGWVTVQNTSGTSFTDAKVKLVAGDVNMVRDSLPDEENSDPPADIAAEPQVSEKAFDDFHLYSLGRPLTLRDQETKQVEFQRAPQVKAVKKYVYDPIADRSVDSEPATDPDEDEAPKKIAVYWEFRNDESNGLGIPLPAGKVRFYRTDDQDGNLEFVGENMIDHTPKDETVSLHTGNAFDLIGERKVTHFARSERQKTIDETIEVTLKNHSQSPREIVVRERPWRWTNWQINNSSSPFNKIDAQKIEFTVKLPPGEEKKVNYTVHYNW